jgi:CBS domain-containing protein
MKKMLRNKVDRLPVFDENRPWKLMGIIAETDILRSIELEESTEI